MKRHVVLVGLLVFALTGCSRAPTLDLTARQSLAAEAADLLAATPLTDDRPGVSIPRDRWPKTIRSLGPQDVRAEDFGLYIAMGSFFAREWGYFVPRNEAAFSPMVLGGDPSYRSLGDGVYSYEVKG
jgi:hypothetical protein